MPRVVVLDTWPLMDHHKRNEPTASRVDWLLSDQMDVLRVMSTHNFGEFIGQMTSRFGDSEADAAASSALRAIHIEPESVAVAIAAGRLKSAYRMSMADAFAAATALRHGAPLWTGDLELLCDDRLWLVEDLRTAEVREEQAELLALGRQRVGLRPAVAQRLGREGVRKRIMDGLGGGIDGAGHDFGLAL